MRKIGLLAVFALAAGCSSGADGTETAAPAVDASPTQIRAFSALKRETNRDWKWMQNARFAMHLSGERLAGAAPTLAGDANVEKTTRDFLAKHRDLFKMRDPHAELALTHTEVDSLAMTHARFQQQTHGVPVVGAETMVHYDARGVLTSLDTMYVPDLDGLDVQPGFDAKLAVDVATADAVSTMKSVDASALTPSSGKLVVFALNDRPATLAYEVTVRAVFGSEPAIWVTTIDAKTGEIIDRFNNLQTIEGSGVGVDGTTKKLQVSTVSGGFSLTDTSRGVTIRTHDAQGAQVTADQGAAVLTSTSSTSWDTADPGAGAAVDAHFNAGLVYDYYKKVHARNAIDGAGGTMVSTAHFGTAFDNAFWDGSSMSYGDGGAVFKPLSSGLDVVAHEFTHGVTERTSALRYQNQSGALNESVSDIFGVFIEHAFKPNEVNNWKMGEAIANAGALRDFKNPAAGRQPDHMTKFVQTQQDMGGVHINSGIPNNAAFLMTMGGSNPTSKTGPQFGIGWEKSEKLWFRTNTKYLTQTATFAAAAQATMQAAKDLALTDNEQNIVDCAWKAVGVVQGACATIVDPKATTPTTPAPGTGTPTGDTTSPDTDTTADDTSTEEEATTAAPKRRRTIMVPQDSAGCSVGPRGATDLGPLAGVFAALALLVLGRRKRA
jgi:bacillolysin